MIIKRISKTVDRVLVLNEQRQVTDFICCVHWLMPNKGYNHTIHWAGPDRVMRDMMDYHQVQAADPVIQQTIDSWR